MNFHTAPTGNRQPVTGNLSTLRKVAVETIALLFVVLFVYAAVTKLLDYEKFRVQLGQSPLLTNFAGWVAWAIPAIEIVLSVMLVIPRSRHVAFFGSFGLMVMFTAYIIAILQFSDYIPCSCGGVLQDMSWTQHLVFNVVFVLLGFGGIVGTAKTVGNRQMQ
jgi:uncharacterized membrane protein YphA (DoxX/SURF4 family)